MSKIHFCMVVICLLTVKTVKLQNNTTNTTNTTNTNNTNSSPSSLTPITSSPSTPVTVSLPTCTSNSSICNFNGNCTINTDQNHECVCETNFSGGKCEYKTLIDLNQCLNGGTSVLNVLTNKLKCICKTDYTGALCEKPLCIDYCYNDGKCNFKDENTTRTCTCLDRFYGDKCEFDKCFDKVNNCSSKCFVNYLNSTCKCACEEQCDELFCNKRGKCQYVIDKLSCKCNTGYSGRTCYTDDCAGYCFNGGECLRNNTDKIGCQCKGNYVGSRCSIDFKAPRPTRMSAVRMITYIFGVSLLICVVAILAYAYKRGLLKPAGDKVINCFAQFRTSAYQRAPQNSTIPYLRTNNNKSQDDLTNSDPFS